MYPFEGMFVPRMLCECCNSTAECQNCAAQYVVVISAELWAEKEAKLNTLVSCSEYGGNLLPSIEQEIEELCLEVNGNDGEEVEAAHENVTAFVEAILHLETFRHCVNNVFDVSETITRDVFKLNTTHAICSGRKT